MSTDLTQTHVQYVQKLDREADVLLETAQKHTIAAREARKDRRKVLNLRNRIAAKHGIAVVELHAS